MMKRIVLVEDDEPIRDALHIVFKSSEYEIIDFESGEQVMNGEIDVPDLFILDKSIAGMNGLDICRFIKENERFRNTPVIMLSANPDIMALAREAGADDALSKPFSLKRLLEMVMRFTSDSEV